MSSMNSGINPDIVKTSLDKVVYPQFDEKSSPDQCDATDSVFFKQDRTEMGSVSYAEYRPPSEFTEHAEEQDYEEDNAEQGTKQTVEIKNYKKDFPIPEEFYEDDQHGFVPNTIKEAGRKAKNSRDKFAFKRSYADALSGVTTPDAVALLSNSHVALDGSTVDNLETAALAPAALDTLVASLELQKDQNGEFGGHSVAGLLTPRALYKTAFEVVESIQVADSAENNKNIFNTKYGTMKLANSPWLNSAYNPYNSSYANSTYFVVSANHHITRYVRLDRQSSMIEPKYDRKGRWFYRLRFRERVVAETWEGVAGSNGSA